MGINNGYCTIFGTIWDPLDSCSSIWVFHMEAKSLHPTRINGRVRREFQASGNDYYKAY